MSAIDKVPNRWDCSGKGWRIKAGRVAIRFTVDPGAGAAPAYFVSRASQFRNMTIEVRGADGRMARRSFASRDLPMADGIARVFAPLPETGGRPASVIVLIDNPRYAGIVSDAALSAMPPLGHAGPTDILIAVLCGLLIAPILFDLGSWRVLREPFLLSHAATGSLMLVYATTSGGVLNRVLPISLNTFSLITNYSFALAIAAAALFFTSVIEADKLDPWHRRIVRWLASYCLALAIFEQVSPLPASLMQQAFYVAWLPVLGIFTWLLVVALRRGSRAARFQALAWTPLMAVSLWRILGNIGLTDTAVAGYVPFYASITLEVLITALGVADRFMSIKRERDVARVEVRQLGEIAESDALTGLLNRRGIEGRLGALEAQGFTCMALLDLDHFKAINDRHGHAVGDQVLRAAAIALSPDADTLAMRMGGEEFLLLLRGRDSRQRAEARRRAITVRVAELVPRLTRPVTASMGLVEVARVSGALREFNLLYAHCDRLLYEAKETGRNRTMAEAMKTFRAPSRRAVATG